MMLVIALNVALTVVIVVVAVLLSGIVSIKIVPSGSPKEKGWVRFPLPKGLKEKVGPRH